MFGWALFFFIFALVAGVLGFGGIAGSAANIASVLFWVGVVLFVMTFIVGLMRGGRTGARDIL